MKLWESEKRDTTLENVMRLWFEKQCPIAMKCLDLRQVLRSYLPNQPTEGIEVVKYMPHTFILRQAKHSKRHNRSQTIDTIPSIANTVKKSTK